MMFSTLSRHLLVANLLFGSIEAWRVPYLYNFGIGSPQVVLEDPILPTNFSTQINYINVPTPSKSCFYKHKGDTVKKTGTFTTQKLKDSILRGTKCKNNNAGTPCGHCKSNDPPTTGTKYPHTYNNIEKLFTPPSTTTLIEFPVTDPNAADEYCGTNPGVLRIVYSVATNGNDYTYWGLMAHDDQGTFHLC